MSYEPPSKRTKQATCSNCNLKCEQSICKLCRVLPQCKKCKKHLPVCCFTNNSDTCSSCVNKFHERKSYAIGKIFSITEIPTNECSIDIDSFIHGSADHIMMAINSALEEHRSIKFFITIDLDLYRPSEAGLQYMNATFRSDVYLIGDVKEVNLNEIAKHLVIKLDLFNERGSGWVLGCVKKCTVSTALYRPLSGSSFQPTPADILEKRAIVNIENFDDDLCFIWSVIAHLYPAKKNPNRLYHYKKYMNEVNVEGLSFPLAVSDVAKFEKLNSNLRINVLAYEDQDFIPLYVSKFHDRPIHINLLLLSDASKHHYTLVRNMSRLIASRSGHKGKHYICDYCLHPFTVKAAFERHVPECGIHAPQRVVYPEPGSTLQWKSPMKTERIPFVIYCDFESFLVPGSKLKNVKDTHVPSGFCCHTVSKFEEYATPPTLFSGEDVMRHFFRHLLDERERISRILSKNEPMLPLTDSQRKQHDEATHCSVCEEPFTVDNWKVKDHCHIEGHFKKSTCNNCNLQLKPPHMQENKCRRFVLHVVIHNLKGYDSHLILKHFDKELVKCEEINVIASNSERYISFAMGSFKFLDSYQFLACSLDELVTNLAHDGYEQFVQTNQWSDHPKLVYSKGVYPYEYMDGPLRFKETCLPPIEAFYSNLTERGISNEDYERAQTVWLTFGCKTMQDYHDIYLKSDVLLLADIFEAFRTMSLDIYKLDPLHYLTLPGLSFDALFKKSKVKLDLITDPEIFLFLENNIRGGISMISKRYSKANNPLLEGYDETQANKYILYTDANNLYGYALRAFLPHSDFRFLSDEEISFLNIDEVGDEASTGYILEVDLEYPSKLHDLHNCYPLAPEKVKIKPEMLSPYSKELSMGQVMTEKLVPNLMNKIKYVLHYRNLKLYTRLGMKITKIHRVLAFSQFPWMREFIDLNTTMRKNSTNNFSKDLFKLFNNAIFGQCLQNNRGHNDVRLVISSRRAKKLAAKPTFKHFQRINDDLVCIEMLKPKVLLDKPIHCGFAVLEISKVLMYEFHYDHMKRRYNDDCKLLMTDTDSLMYEITCPNVYDHIFEDRALYDTSNYKESSKLFSNENCKVVGKFKDETGGVPIAEFVGLKAKMYSLLIDGHTQKMTAKGVKKSFIKNHVTHELYHHTLVNRTVTRAQFLNFRSFQHSLHTVEIDKVCLSAFDDKRYILSNGVDTLAYGHYSIK